MLTDPLPAETCARCGHTMAKHGAGCTHGWFANGPECHCPNDSEGQVAVECAFIGCTGATPTHVDRDGQFVCDMHAHGPYGARPFDEIKSWENS